MVSYVEDKPKDMYHMYNPQTKRNVEFCIVTWVNWHASTPIDNLRDIFNIKGSCRRKLFDCLHTLISFFEPVASGTTKSNLSVDTTKSNSTADTAKFDLTADTTHSDSSVDAV